MQAATNVTAGEASQISDVSKATLTSLAVNNELFSSIRNAYYQNPIYDKAAQADQAMKGNLAYGRGSPLEAVSAIAPDEANMMMAKIYNENRRALWKYVGEFLDAIESRTTPPDKKEIIDYEVTEPNGRKRYCQISIEDLLKSPHSPTSVFSKAELQKMIFACMGASIHGIGFEAPGLIQDGRLQLDVLKKSPLMPPQDTSHTAQEKTRETSIGSGHAAIDEEIRQTKKAIDLLNTKLAFLQQRRQMIGDEADKEIPTNNGEGSMQSNGQGALEILQAQIHETVSVLQSNIPNRPSPYSPEQIRDEAKTTHQTAMANFVINYGGNEKDIKAIRRRQSDLKAWDQAREKARKHVANLKKALDFAEAEFQKTQPSKNSHSQKFR